MVINVKLGLMNTSLEQRDDRSWCSQPGNLGTVVPSAPRTVFPGWDADKGSTSYVYTFLKYLDQSIL